MIICNFGNIGWKACVKFNLIDFPVMDLGVKNIFGNFCIVTGKFKTHCYEGQFNEIILNHKLFAIQKVNKRFI